MNRAVLCQDDGEIFVELQMPNDLASVQDIFSHRGAYRRFKDLLEYRDLLQDWYDFESRREQEALREWCRENKVELTPA